MEHLLSAPGIDVNIKDDVSCYTYTLLSELLHPLQGGDTPLHWAVREGHTTCVEHLLFTPGIDVNIKDMVSCYTYTLLSELLHPLQGGDIPLHFAARGGHTTCVEHLLSTPGIDLDTAFKTIF